MQFRSSIFGGLGKEEMRVNDKFFGEVYTERLAFYYICFFCLCDLFGILGFAIGIGLEFKVCDWDWFRV